MEAAGIFRWGLVCVAFIFFFLLPYDDLWNSTSWEKTPKGVGLRVLRVERVLPPPPQRTYPPTHIFATVKKRQPSKDGSPGESPAQQPLGNGCLSKEGALGAGWTDVGLSLL